MNSALPYSENNDQELYLKTDLPFSKQKIIVNAATIASEPDKPNEDAFSVVYENDILLAGIFDGTTSLKPIKSLGSQTGARFASHFLKEKFTYAKRTDSPHALLLKLNQQLLKKSLEFEGATIDDTHTFPSSTGTIIKIDAEKNKLELAHVGDSYCILFFSDGHSQLVTDDKNDKFDAKMFSLIAHIAKEKRITPKEARQTEQFKKALIEMFIKRNNNPDGSGSGIINGDSQIKQYIQTETFSLENIKAVLIGTDGLIPLGWSEQEENDRQKLLKEITDGGFQKMFKSKKESEDEDPDWDHIRYKHSDDATGILLQMGYSKLAL